MALLGETAEDVTWRNRGHKEGIRHEEDKKDKRGPGRNLREGGGRQGCESVSKGSGKYRDLEFRVEYIQREQR